MSSQLLLPGVLVGATVLLYATTYLERMIGLRSDDWPLPRDVDLVSVVASVSGLSAQPAVQVNDIARPHHASRITRKKEAQWASP